MKQPNSLVVTRASRYKLSLAFASKPKRRMPVSRLLDGEKHSSYANGKTSRMHTRPYKCVVLAILPHCLKSPDNTLRRRGRIGTRLCSEKKLNVQLVILGRCTHEIRFNIQFYNIFIHNRLNSIHFNNETRVTTNNNICLHVISGFHVFSVFLNKYRIRSQRLKRGSARENNSTSSGTP